MIGTQRLMALEATNQDKPKSKQGYSQGCRPDPVEETLQNGLSFRSFRERELVGRNSHFCHLAGSKEGSLPTSRYQNSAKNSQLKQASCHFPAQGRE